MQFMAAVFIVFPGLFSGLISDPLTTVEAGMCHGSSGPYVAGPPSVSGRVEAHRYRDRLVSQMRVLLPVALVIVRKSR